MMLVAVKTELSKIYVDFPIKVLNNVLCSFLWILCGQKFWIAEILLVAKSVWMLQSSFINSHWHMTRLFWPTWVEVQRLDQMSLLGGWVLIATLRVATSPITSWQTEKGKVETVTDFLFLGSKVTADSGCSHEIKRHLLLGRKARTNLHNVLKSRDITLLTKIHLVKSMVFQLWMWNLDHKEGWGSKNWCFWIVVLEMALESPLDSKEIQLVNPKRNQPWILEGLMLKFQYFGHLMWRADSLEKTLMPGKIEGRRRRGKQRMRWLGSITDCCPWQEFEQALGDIQGQRSLAFCSSRDHKDWDMT